MGPAKSGRHHPTHQIKLPKLRVRSRSGLLNLEQRSARLLIIPTATQNHSNPHGDAERQQSARSLSEKIKTRSKQATAAQQRRRSVAVRLRRLRFTWCKAGSVPSAGRDGSRSAPSEPEAARRLGEFGHLSSRIGNRSEEEARRPLLPPLSPLAAWWVVVWWRPERGEGGLL